MIGCPNVPYPSVDRFSQLDQQLNVHVGHCIKILSESYKLLTLSIDSHDWLNIGKRYELLISYIQPFIDSHCNLIDGQTQALADFKCPRVQPSMVEYGGASHIMIGCSGVPCTTVDRLSPLNRQLDTSQNINFCVTHCHGSIVLAAWLTLNIPCPTVDALLPLVRPCPGPNKYSMKSSFRPLERHRHMLNHTRLDMWTLKLARDYVQPSIKLRRESINGWTQEIIRV